MKINPYSKIAFRFFNLSLISFFLGLSIGDGTISCSSSSTSPSPQFTSDGPSTGAVSGHDDSNSVAGASGSAAGVSGSSAGVSGTTAGVSGSSGGVSGSAAGVSGSAGSGIAGAAGSAAGASGSTAGVSGSAAGVSGAAAGVSGTSAGTSGASSAGISGSTAGVSGATAGVSGSAGVAGTPISSTRFNTTTIGTNRITMTTLHIGSLTRDMAVFVPSVLGSPPPLVIALHGTNGHPAAFICSADSEVTGLTDPYGSAVGCSNYGITNLSRSQGFLLIAPYARDNMQGNSQNRDHSSTDEYGRWWQTYATDASGAPLSGITPIPSNNPDLLLIQAIIQEASTAYHIDTHRVYVMGHSAGAFFSYLTAMALHDQIAAFAENAGGLINCTNRPACTFQSTAPSASTCSTLASQPSYCSCSSSDWPISIPTSGYLPAGYLAHGTNDNLVSVYYTCQLENRMQSAAAPYSTQIVPGATHDIVSGFPTNAWNFMRTYSIP